MDRSARIVGEGLAGLAVKVNVAGLAALVADMNPASFGREVGVLVCEPGNIARPAAGPVAEGEEGGAPGRAVAFDEQVANDLPATIAELLSHFPRALGGRRGRQGGRSQFEQNFVRWRTIPSAIAPAPLRIMN